MTSGFSTTPSISNLACTTYLIVNVWDAPVPVSMTLLVSLILFDYVNRIKARFSRDDEIELLLI